MEEIINFRTLWEAIKQSASSIIITDPAGTILFVNPKFLELTGYNEDEVVGKNPRILKSGETPPETYVDMWRNISMGKEWRGEVRNRRKNGSLYWGSLTLAPVKNEEGKITHLIGIEEDITAQKNLDKQLRKANDELVRSNQDLEQFTSILSHDLRGPLGSLNLAIEMLTESLGADISEKPKKFLEMCQSLSQKMATLVTELLGYVRSGSNDKRHELVEVGKIIDTIKENLSAFIYKKNAQIFSESLPVLSGNKTLIALLFQNLIENGIKYNRDPNPAVWVTANREKERWIFSIKDNGIGINPKDTDKLFKTFSRLETGNDFTGTGLGLATCKRIVEIFGGKIWIESEEGKGATFKFTFPDEKILEFDN